MGIDIVGIAFAVPAQAPAFVLVLVQSQVFAPATAVAGEQEISSRSP